jgi:hypothetical protein
MNNSSADSNPRSRYTEDDVFSCDPEKRAIQMDFLQRLLTARDSPLRKHLNVSSDSFAANLAAMNHPLFVWLAKKLDQTLPVNADFGRFRDEETPSSKEP